MRFTTNDDNVDDNNDNNNKDTSFLTFIFHKVV